MGNETGMLEEVQPCIGFGDIAANRQTGLEKEAGSFRVRDFYTVNFNTDVAGGCEDLYTL